MGMPITTYNVLNALDRWDDEYSIRMVKDTLGTFNAFAFIIYDPDADENSDFGQRNRAFEQTINKEFDYLDHITGDKLLFFALVDPPKKWLKYGEPRSYYQQLLAHQNQIISNDRSVTAFSLAQSLDVPYEMLPCLVITPDFSTKRVVWVRTCPDHVINQLAWLGYRVQQSRSIIAVRAFFKDITENINLCEGSGITELESSLAKALTDVMSFMIENDRPDLNPVDGERVQSTLRELKNTLDNLKQTRELDTEELDSLCEKIVAFLAHLNTRPRQNLANFISINVTDLEVDSRLILKTAHMVNDFLMNSSTQMIDYTPVAICLAKVFEREINLSVVHWIRQHLGVDLPDYFNRYQNSVNAMFCPPKGRRIDFNRSGQQGKWNPPAIGESQIAYGLMAEDMNHWLNQPQDFLGHWDTIRQVRNKAAHTQFVGIDSVQTIQNTLNQLARNDIFQTLFEMKQTGRQNGFQLNQ